MLFYSIPKSGERLKTVDNTKSLWEYPTDRCIASRLIELSRSKLTATLQIISGHGNLAIDRRISRQLGSAICSGCKFVMGKPSIMLGMVVRVFPLDISSSPT